MSKTTEIANVPRFCQKHQLIHICDEISISNQLKTAEANLGARVRRLHGTLTAEELEQEAKKLNKKDAPGSIGAILAAAKEKITANKSKMKIMDDDTNTKTVSQDEVNDRMAALKARMNGETPSSSNNNSPSVNSTSGGLSSVIERAHKVTNKIWKEYKVPERGTFGEESPTSHVAHADSNIVEEKKKSKTTTISKTKNKNADKMPSIATEKLEIKSDETITEYDLDARSGVSEAPKTLDNITFTAEQTQEMIANAVKLALAEVGIIGKTKAEIAKTKEINKAKTTKK